MRETSQSAGPPSSAAPRFAGADGFRALACLAVFSSHVTMFHAPLWEQGSGGWGRLIAAGNSGVAVFFVLSGFLLSMPFHRAFQQARPLPDLKVYARRRLARIVPGYFLCVLVLALLSGAWMTGRGLGQILACLTFTNPFFAATYTPDFDSPLWSISIEMQFYALLPLFMLGYFRCASPGGARCYTLLVLVLLHGVQYGLVRVAPAAEAWVGNPAWFQADAWPVERNALILFTHFLIGSLAADLWCVGQRRLPAGTCGARRWGNGFDLASLLLMLLLVLLLGTTLVEHLPGVWRLWRLPLTVHHWPVMHLLLGLLLVTLSFSRRCGAWLDNRFFRLTATLSFGIYMWHLPMLNWMGGWWPWPRDGSTLWVALFALSALGATYGVAALSYYLWEIRFLKAPARSSPRPAPVPAVSEVELDRTKVF